MNKKVEDFHTSEYDALIPNDPENYNTAKIARDSVELDDFERNNNMNPHEGQWANTIHEHHRNSSINSERTVYDEPRSPTSPTHSEDTLHDVKIRQNTHSRRALLRLLAQSAFAFFERFIVFAGFAQLLIGIVTYTGKAFTFTPLEPSFTSLQEDVERIIKMAA